MHPRSITTAVVAALALGMAPPAAHAGPTGARSAGAQTCGPRAFVASSCPRAP